MSKIKHEYEFPLYLFHSGKNYKSYEFFGCHKINDGRFVFRVWAPHAVAVSVERAAFTPSMAFTVTGMWLI